MKVAGTPAEAEQIADTMLGMDIKGHRVHRVLVTADSDIAEELYLIVSAGPVQPHLPGHGLA